MNEKINMSYEARVAKQEENWTNRFGEPVSAPRNDSMVDFNNGEHTRELHPAAPVSETVFDITKHSGIIDPNMVDHFIDPYTDLVSMAPQPVANGSK